MAEPSRAKHPLTVERYSVVDTMPPGVDVIVLVHELQVDDAGGKLVEAERIHVHVSDRAVTGGASGSARSGRLRLRA